MIPPTTTTNMVAAGTMILAPILSLMRIGPPYDAPKSSSRREECKIEAYSGLIPA